MSQLSVPRIHPSAGVPRGQQPLETLFDTYHIVATERGGTVITDRVKIARNPMRSAGNQRAAAIQTASFKLGIPSQRIRAVRV